MAEFEKSTLLPKMEANLTKGGSGTIFEDLIGPANQTQPGRGLTDTFSTKRDTRSPNMVRVRGTMVASVDRVWEAMAG